MVGAELGGHHKLVVFDVHGDDEPAGDAGAYCRARCPSPPTPKIATVSAGATRATLIAL
jgi:hypothetical protein